MKRRATLSILLILVAAAVTMSCAEPVATSEAPAAASPAQAPAAAPAPVLDGETKSFVVVGYSTSYAWPDMLQELLDEHAGGERIYHVLNAVIGGSPVGRWIADPGSDDYDATYAAMQRDFFGDDARLRGDAPAPSVAVVQQSLQRTPTPATRLGPVTSVDDAEGIRVGADSLEQLATQLRGDGIERVYIAMHIYKQGYEPEVGNERFALEALLDRGHDFVFRGPDVWSATIGHHPEAFTDDGLHPNELGAKMMAAAWYRALAGDDAREDIIEALNDRSYDVDTMMREYLDWRRMEPSDS